MTQKIQLKHPTGKKSIMMDKVKYDILTNALLNHLKTKGESTFTEILQSISEDFKKNQIKFQGSIQWHIEWVKLDLEANKKIRRVPNTTPEKYGLVR
jgi:ubiquitin C-terminal hydrolase